MASPTEPADTHFLANHRNGLIEPVSDSPFQLRQPHSLPDILNQLEWIQELSAIRTQSLELDPDFEPALNELLRMKCSRRVDQKTRSFRDVYAPICCWPNEQNVVCFEQSAAKGSKKRKSFRCFRLESPPPSLPNASFAVQFVYFRCNTPYTGRSYPPPAFAPLIGPLLRPAAELRQTELRRFIQKVEAEELLKSEKLEKPTARPVLALDYGGYSEERVRAHLYPVWPEGVSPGELRQQLHFGDADGGEGNAVGAGGTTKDRRSEGRLQQVRPEVAASAIGRLQNRNQVVSSLDIALPDDLPIPPAAMVEKGKSLSPSINRHSLAEICQSHRKAVQLLEQPVSSWVGHSVEDLFDLDSSLPGIDKLEPECSDPDLASKHDSVLHELDILPAYQYRQHLTKFYKPEKALRNTLQSLGSSGELDQIEHVAARLHFALKSDDVHWALSTLSALYWRVQGDPVNADFPHALQFYHSTLALQSNFEPANLRILAVHCMSLFPSLLSLHAHHHHNQLQPQSSKCSPSPSPDLRLPPHYSPSPSTFQRTSLGPSSISPLYPCAIYNDGSSPTPSRRSSTVDESGRFCSLPHADGQKPEVLVSLCFFEGQNRLAIGVDKVALRGQAQRENGSETEVFVRIASISLQGTETEKHKSASVKMAPEMTPNTQTVFSLCRPAIDTTQILVQLFAIQHGVFLRRKMRLIGSLTLGGGRCSSSSDAREHWRQMLQGKGTTVDKWHILETEPNGK
uniref:TPR_REGION domain-containing protein n=1 Tax=Globodera pallida TaxID=36090 RepID=A0A183CL46_GLOPA